MAGGEIKREEHTQGKNVKMKRKLGRIEEINRKGLGTWVKRKKNGEKNNCFFFKQSKNMREIL